MGTLGSLVIIGCHLYVNFCANAESSWDLKLEDEIRSVTKRLYNEEGKSDSPLLTKYTVSFQGETEFMDKDDKAPLPLLELHDDFYLQNSSTISLLKDLFDNYVLEVQQGEVITQERNKEETAFLKAVLNTPVMQKSMQFLAGKGKVGTDYDSQLKLLKQLWFEQYARNKAGVGSSGFEHVFLAELKRGKVLGLHNWIYFAEQEKQKHLDYQGYMDNTVLEKKNQFLITIRSKFHGLLKPYNTILIGTTPELEISLYTICFLLLVNKPCAVQFGSVQFNIMTYSWNKSGKRFIASAFPAVINKK